MGKSRLSVPSQEILMLRHFKDINDLRYSRDSSIESGQEELAFSVAIKIYEDFKNNPDNKSIFLSVSNKKRAFESANLIVSQIKKIDCNVKIFVISSNDLIDLDHGEYNLPNDYKVGDFYPTFDKAWEIFTNETFNNNNPNYRFGDPVLNSEGLATYPELIGCFTRFGENYREICIRLYKSILKIYANKERFLKNGIKPYILTHSLPFGIFRSLVDISEKVRNENFNFETGTLMKICWDYYNSGKLSRSNYGQLSGVPVKLIDNDKFIEILEKEVYFLEQNHGK